MRQGAIGFALTVEPHSTSPSSKMTHIHDKVQGLPKNLSFQEEYLDDKAIPFINRLCNDICTHYSVSV